LCRADLVGDPLRAAQTPTYDLPVETGVADPADATTPPRRAGAAPICPVDRRSDHGHRTTPLHGSSLPWDRVPANVQTGARLRDRPQPRAGAFRLSDTALGSVHVNDAQAKPAATDLQFRGFTARRCWASQQGLSGLRNGMRGQ